MKNEHHYKTGFKLPIQQDHNECTALCTSNFVYIWQNLWSTWSSWFIVWNLLLQVLEGKCASTKNQCHKGLKKVTIFKYVIYKQVNYKSITFMMNSCKIPNPKQYKR